jgi:N-acetylglucosamine-6-phosphate deacetylase
MPGIKAYTSGRIFTGNIWLPDHAILVKDGVIADIISSSSLPADVEIKDYPGHIIAPAFIDLQIYGAYGKLLAVYPEADSLYKLNDYCKKGGAAYCLPTVATNTKNVFYKCIDSVKDYWNKGGDGILGLHLEGPWINPIKKGAHIKSLIHAPSLPETKELLDYGKDVIKMITLAPEICSNEIIELILYHKIVISAGHSNAIYKEAMNGFENGICSVTHLYNAMSPLHHREPGLVGATLDHSTIMASIIPDGHHVDYAAIRIAKKLMKERLFAVTDAVTDTDSGYYQHKLAGDKYEAGGILSGSALTMSKAVKNLVQQVGIDPGEALRMCSLYPARVMRLEHELGKIEKGYRAKLVVLDNEFETDTVIYN